uniref:Putative 28 kDa metastriate family member n=1 Tax=Rhipicephalus pulchellus TaxID=72859 RepID=L7MBP9_RHIPC
MFRLSVILYCLFLQQCNGENSSMESTRPAVIGTGVEVKIMVLYDTAAYKKSYKAQHPLKHNVIWYFLDKFDEVERHFHKQNVMVTLSVVMVELNERIWVQKHGSHDTHATLQKLQTIYEDYYPRPNKTAAFLFTSERLPNESDIATLGTICHADRSTGIIVLKPGSTNYTPIVEATAQIFGASGSANFTFDDIQKMNSTFSNCHIKRRRRYTTTEKTTATPTTAVMNNTSTDPTTTVMNNTSTK